MTKREVKKWAYGLVADLARTSIDSTEAIPEDEPDRERKMAAVVDVIAALYRKSNYDSDGWDWRVYAGNVIYAAPRPDGEKGEGADEEGSC